MAAQLDPHSFVGTSSAQQPTCNLVGSSTTPPPPATQTPPPAADGSTAVPDSLYQEEHATFQSVEIAGTDDIRISISSGGSGDSDIAALSTNDGDPVAKLTPAPSGQPTARVASRPLRLLFQLLFCNSYTRLIFYKDRRAYFWIWMSGFAAQIGDYFSFVSTLSLINSISSGPSSDSDNVDGSTHASGFILSGLFLSYCIVPMVLLPVTGVVADKINKRHIMIVADLVRACVMGCFVVLATIVELHAKPFSTHSVALIVGLIYLFNSITFAADAFFGPCREGLVPTLVPAEELPTANALDSITYTSASSLGSSVGGLVTSLVGIHVGYIINGLAFLFSAFCIFMAQKKNTTDEFGNGNGDTNVQVKQLDKVEERDAILDESPLRRSYSSSDALSASEENNGQLMSNPATTESETSSALFDTDSDAMLLARTSSSASSTNLFVEHAIPEMLSDQPLPPQQAPQIDRHGYGKVLLQTLLRPVVGFLSSFLDGLLFLWRHKFVVMLVLAKGMGAACWGAIDLDNVRFATDEFQWGGSLSTTLGLIYLVQGLACGLAPVFVERVLPVNSARADRGAVLSGFICLAGGISLISWSPNFIVFLLGNAITSTGVGISWVYSTTILQQVLPVRLRGRIFSLDFMMHAFGEIISLIWCGVALDLLNFSARNLAVSIAILGLVFLSCWLSWAFFTCHISKHVPLEQNDDDYDITETEPSPTAETDADAKRLHSATPIIYQFDPA